LRLASGIPPVKKYMDAGVKVGLGVDGGGSSDGSVILEARQAFLLARLRMSLLPPEGPSKYRLLSQSHRVRSREWMTAREALELATRGGAAVLGRLDDIGSLEAGKCADFFTIDLHTVDFAGALHDPVAAVIFCAPQKARHTIINGRQVVKDGRVMTVDMQPIVAEHNRRALSLARGK